MKRKTFETPDLALVERLPCTNSIPLMKAPAVCRWVFGSSPFSIQSEIGPQGSFRFNKHPQSNSTATVPITSSFTVHRPAALSIPDRSIASSRSSPFSPPPPSLPPSSPTFSEYTSSSDTYTDPTISTENSPFKDIKDQSVVCMQVLEGDSLTQVSLADVLSLSTNSSIDFTY